MTMKIAYFCFMKIEDNISIYQIKENIQDCLIGAGILVPIMGSPDWKVIINIVYQLSFLYNRCKGNNV